ncbi:cell wall hydrolase [Novosphingobium sp.]|uniref:cell wall hydrolase n=1 Tax=Novosphingobium sp. TaxID=1874826 RepID=UPI003D14C32D
MLLFVTALVGIGFAFYLIFVYGTTAAPHSHPARVAAAALDTGAVIVPPDAIDNEYLSVSHDDARASNARVAFAIAPVSAASPVTLHLSGDDDARATDCLAAAAWYEAGDSMIGQQAVIQVALNRMRHAVFPKTVCGVVFQGSERSTGCQFSFTCDGSLRRIPSAAQWARARGAALVAMHGLVFAPVGYATHYHTDWVVPKWRSSVDKVARVETQLFYRWPGAMGQPRAFGGQHQGPEPVEPALAAISAVHRPVAVGTTPAGATGTPAPTPAASPEPGHGAHSDVRMMLIPVHDSDFPGNLALSALAICQDVGAKPCTVAGYLHNYGAVTTDALGYPHLPVDTPDFYYFHDASRNRETVLWNCSVFKRSNPTQCLPSGFQPVH